jgi:hypothetical protein
MHMSAVILPLWLHPRSTASIRAGNSGGAHTRGSRGSRAGLRSRRNQVSRSDIVDSLLQDHAL